MLDYIDAIIPLVGGIFLVTGGDYLVNDADVSSARKKRIIRISSIVLIILAVIYLIVKIFMKTS